MHLQLLEPKSLKTTAPDDVFKALQLHSLKSIAPAQPEQFHCIKHLHIVDV